MAVTSGATIAIFIGRSWQHLEGEVARRIDAQHLEGNTRRAASPDLVGRLGIEDLGQLDRLVVAARTRRTSARRSSRTGSRGRRASRRWFGQTMTTQPPGRHTRSISARPASPPCPGAGVKAEQATTRSAKSSGSGRSSKNPSATRTRSPWSGRARACAAGSGASARGLDRHDLLPALDELQRQPAGARADLDDPLDVARQPAEHAGMEPLGADQPVIELRLEPVQQLPGQHHVGSRVTGPRRGEPARLLAR